jgi:hypothetical protein
MARASFPFLCTADSLAADPDPKQKAKLSFSPTGLPGGRKDGTQQTKVLIRIPQPATTIPIQVSYSDSGAGR